MINTTNKAYALCLALLLYCCLSAQADYHYASHTGASEYPYTSWATAADSIQKSVDAAVVGDTVYIGAGDWYQYVYAYDSDTIAFIGMGIDITVCHYDSIHSFIFDEVTNGCLIEGITFTDYIGAGGIYGRLNAGFSVRNCTFKNLGLGVGAEGFPVVEVTNCYFDSCSRAVSSCLGIGNVIIRNNVILNSYGIYGFSAIDLWCNTAIIQNNIIINPPPPFFVNGIKGNVLSSTITNNIIIDGHDGINANPFIKYNNIVKDVSHTAIKSHGADTLANNSITDCDGGVICHNDMVVNYNNFWNNGVDLQGNMSDSVGNIFCNPMYVSDYDVHLQAFSPLIDAGDPDFYDIDGSRSDIGAYGGPLGESYIYLDSPPSVPDSITGNFNQAAIILNWALNTEADFSNYILYKDTVSGFEPSVFNLIAEPESSYYIDDDVTDEHNYYYRIASLDNQENVSDYSEELEVITTDIWNQPGAQLPQITSIKTNYPNPFNTSTTIV